MSRLVYDGRAEKGSRFWMQECINNEDLLERLNKDILNAADLSGIDLNVIEWLSPLADNNYKEYQLSQTFLCENFGLENFDFSFWPKRGPQWDAIGIADDKTIILVEAKAHLGEWSSYLSSKNHDNTRLIKKAITEVFSDYGGDETKRTHGYYQLSNRIVFWHRFKQYNHPCVLILLNFTNDRRFKPTSEEDFSKKCKKVFLDLTGSVTPPEGIIPIYFNVG